MLYLGQTGLFQLRKGLTAQLNVCRNLRQQQKQQWGRPVAGAAARADAVVADAGDSVVADSSITAEISAVIIGQADLLHMAVLGLAALEAATLAGDVATGNAHVSYVAPPVIKPNSALRPAKSTICCKAMSCL